VRAQCDSAPRYRMLVSLPPDARLRTPRQEYSQERQGRCCHCVQSFVAIEMSPAAGITQAGGLNSRCQLALSPTGEKEPRPRHRR